MARDVVEGFGGRLRELRERAGLSLTQLAAQAGCSASMLSALETGGKQPSLFRALSLARALSTSVDELCKPAGGPAPTTRAGRPRKAGQGGPSTSSRTPR